MNGQSTPKLKYLIQSVPPGFLVDSAWTARHAISRQSASAYIKQGWLERIAKGVYRRPFSARETSEAMTGWKIPLLSAQWIMGHAFHVGGLSALGLRGHSHYLQLGGDTRVYLYGSDIPDWLMTLTTDARFVRRGHGLFHEETGGVENSEFSLSDDHDEERAMSPWRWPIKMSSDERAILEVLDELPKNESFHSIDMMLQGMVNLRPKLLTTLLAQCRSVKVKRLFFVYADKHAHAWLKHIDRSRIDMGRGDRALVPGGRLHPIYRITVPADLVPQENIDGA
ncbi:type IV toxin-antitoxin system AbiEi family antitoxin [Pararhizobium sp. BT-229]|uniref:type IV toxin-antitoxin system AbiEi family antitoxin n=1 Tax=Pararhizobium sp. BT-229 TaxID=2986923 RepID=UPI0021F6D3A9|nr:type IV toxin-antitoxin system AbiEi family antitoxin [Pararhizobium sp. BT-229]MCV9966807.1 type IV toxin-antitoxin system AbiEi family antitoxin [Pararhizobium sp. BT-229]